ncbi:MAG TPA: SRPBCC family protein [Dehalococcoidia bacterium]|nr:SRPBCC family protein [Dehalococcoidia bacterium]
MEATAEIIINRPLAEVAAFVMDPANDLSWIGGVKEVQILTSLPLQAGTRVRRVAAFLGRRIEYVNEVVSYDPPRRLEMRSVQGPFPMTVVYELKEAESGTRLHIRAAGDATGFFKLAGPLLSNAVRRSVNRDLRTLKERLEADY